MLKRTAVAAGMLLALGIFAWFGYGYAKDDGLAGYWKFNEGKGDGETAKDISGNGNDGKIYGAVVNETGQALSFDGIDDYVDCGNGANLDIADAITIEARIKLNSYSSHMPGGWSCIVSKGQSWMEGLAFWIDPGGQLTFSVEGVHHKFGFVPLKQWKHVAVTFSLADQKIIAYIDGVSSHPQPREKSLPTQKPTLIGVHHIGKYGQFDGEIAEVAIYSRALSADEIQNRYKIKEEIVRVSAPELVYKFGRETMDTNLLVRLSNDSQESRALKVNVEGLENGEKHSERITLSPGETKESVFPVSIGEKNYKFQIAVIDALSDRYYYFSKGEAQVPLSSYFTRDYYTKERIAKLKGKINTKGKDAFFHLTASLVMKKGGEIVMEKKDVGISGKEFVVEADISSLPPGNYQSLLSVHYRKKLVFSDDISLVKYAPAPYEIKIDRENLFVLVNDKPFFPIGITAIPENRIAEYAKAGFNITSGNTSANYMDTAYYNNMLVHVNNAFYLIPRSFYSTKPPGEVEKAIRESSLPGLAGESKNHPAFGGYIWDEPWQSEEAGAAILYAITKEYDPYHPVCPIRPFPAPSLPSFDFIDVNIADLYWMGVPFHNDYPVWTGIDNNTAFSEKHKKPFWFMLQAAGWIANSAVTPDEQRLQTYMGLIHGAKGIYYWAYVLTFPSMRDMLKKLAGEMRELSPVLLTLNPEQAVTGREETGIHLLFKKYGDKTYLISANNSGDTQKNIRIIFPRVNKNTITKVLFENREVQVKGGVLTDEFAPYATHVYEIEGLTTEINEPFEANLEMVSSNTVAREIRRRWPDWGDASKGSSRTISKLENPGFEEEEDGQPRIWNSWVGGWEEKEYLSLDYTCAYEGKKSLKMFIPEPTLFSENKGYGWINGPTTVSSFDLGSENPLFRDGNEIVSPSIFKVSLPNGKYKLTAAMRNVNVNRIFELESGSRQSLSLKTKEIPDIVKIFPSYHNRIREYVFDVEIKDKSLDLEITDGFIFSLTIIPAGKEKGELKFDFGTDESPVEKGYAKISAPKFYYMSLRLINSDASPRISVTKGKEYVFSAYLKSNNIDFPVSISMLGHPEVWSKIKSHVVNVDTEWKKYTVSFVPTGEKLHFEIRIDGKPGTLWIDNLQLEQIH